MDIPMQYRAYELVNKLTTQGFRIIAGDYKTDEIWLERKADRKSAIIRVKPQTFDWSNHLRQDSQIAYQQMQRIQAGYCELKCCLLFNLYRRRTAGG